MNPTDCKIDTTENGLGCRSAQYIVYSVWTGYFTYASDIYTAIKYSEEMKAEGSSTYIRRNPYYVPEQKKTRNKKSQ